MFSKMLTMLFVGVCTCTFSTGVANAQLLQFEDTNVLGGSITVGTTTVTFDVPSVDSTSAHERLQRILFLLRSGANASTDAPARPHTTFSRELLDIVFWEGTPTGVGGEADSTNMSNGMNPTPSSICIPFSSQNFSIGAESPEIKRLQEFLNRDARTRVAGVGGGSPGEETMYYGERTRAAVSAFQSLHRDAILTPLGLNEPTGYWGARTREYANRLLGCAVAQ